ncbi:MAG TPA: CPBP family intramembrane glutamic endopeptidase [Candidatus Eisenbacteria bacterium]|jgi:hypothetical protein
MGLLCWLLALAAIGLGALLLGEQELALLVVIAGTLIAAQAADVGPRWTGLYLAVSWVVPVAAAGVFASLAVLLLQGDLAPGPRWGLVAFSSASAIACLASAFPTVADALVRALFRTEPASHVLRLCSRLVLAGILLAVPGWFALRDLLTHETQQLIEQLPLGGGLVGYVLLALASVGFLVRRDLRATLERLGLRRISVGDAGVVVLGVIGLLLLNNGADWVQKHAFPELWKRDQEFNQALAGGLSHAQAVMLGLSAGIGEEITMRGALQPRLGLVLTSLLFASLHVQYSWYGMAVIFLLGMVLGGIRKGTSTTAAMAVHALYDILAVLTT